jgi:hypothetical protein
MERKLAAMVVALAACASTTKLTNVQVAPESPRAKLTNVLVVGLVKDPAARQAYEMEMVKTLQAAGVQAASSQALLPIGEAPTREALERLVAERGFDGALIGRLVDARTEVRAVPPSAPAYGGFYGYYGWAAPMAYSPGYLETTKKVVVETRAFRTAGEGTAVFSATSESVDPSSAKDASQELAKLVVNELRKNGFV